MDRRGDRSKTRQALCPRSRRNVAVPLSRFSQPSGRIFALLPGSSSQSPGFAVTAILVFALGIAASTAIFAFVDAALVRPLPYREPSRLMALFEHIPVGDRYHISYADYLDWKL